MLGPIPPGLFMTSRRTFAAHYRPAPRSVAHRSRPSQPRLGTGTLLCLLLLLGLVRSTRAQTTIHIPTDQPTIQAGINAAHNGDTVLVAPGTYYENIDFKGKAITVTSSAGPAATIIDGGSTGAAVTFKTGETSSSTISGFTIQHGGSFYLSGVINFIGSVYLQGSTPTILNNIITLSNCWGIASYYSAPLIQNNTISATQDPQGSCSFGGGAAILVWGGINDQYNQSGINSGQILGNTIENNVESGLEDAGGNGGAGIAVWGGTAIIENNIIRNNASPGGSGGAINFVNSEGTLIAQNLIYGNSAGCGGGAIATDAHGLYVINNTIADNVGIGNAGFSECTNIAQIYPSPDTYGRDAPSDIFINNIISGSTSYPAVNCSWYSTPDQSYQPTFQNNILYNSGGPFFGSYCVDVSGQYNNIAADPQFVSPSTGNYHLKSTSPAIDNGQNSVLQTILTLTGKAFSTDFDGNPRVQATNSSACIIDMGAYEYPGTQGVCSTAETLQSSLNPSTFGQTITFTAQLSSASGIPTGTVQFTDGSTLLGTATVSGTGMATLSTSLLTIGSHTITATYQPTGIFPAATSALIQVVDPYPTTTTLTSTPNPAAYGQPVLFSVTITNASANPGTPTGTITLTDGATQLTTAALVAINSVASGVTFTTSSLAVGSHTITATYTPTGSFGSGAASLTQNITGLATTATLASSLNPAPYGQSVTFTATIANTSATSGTPTGTVTFTDGTPVTVTQTLTAASATTATASFSISTLAVGNDPITATYTPTGAFAASNAALTQVITGLTSATTLTAAPNPALAGQPVTLTATVTGSATTPAGPVTFYNGLTPIAVVSLDATGHATFTTSALPVGADSLTAVYAGSSPYATSTSPVFLETIQPIPQDFTLTLANPAITIQTQHHTTTTLTLTSLGGFADTLPLTCANLPAYVTCRPTPASPPLAANASSSVSLYLDTDSVLGYARNTAPPTRSASPIAWAFLFAPFSLAAAFLRRNRRPRLLLLLLATLPLSLALAGCGEIIFPYEVPPSATPGTYTIPITATGATTGLTHTAQLTLTITP